MDTKKLRQKILDLAIHGKLVPQDPNDEPASVLLERIRAEKERLIAEGKIKRSKKSVTSDTSHYENVPFEIPEGWCWCMLPDICIIPITDGTHQTPKYTTREEGIPFLSSKDVTKRIIDWSSIKYITRDLHDVLYSRIAPQKFDILLAKNGTTGVAAMVEDDRVFDIYVTLAVIRPAMPYIHPNYLLHIINSHFCKSQFNSHLTGIGLPNLHLTDINKTYIPLPPYNEQCRIIEKLEKLLSVVDNIENCNSDIRKSIQSAKSKVLDLAIHGKLVPQDANDEPASDLLRRINPKAVASCDNPHYEQIPFEIPYNWVWVTIDEINKFKSKSVNPQNYPTDQFELYSVPTFETGEPEFPFGKDVASSKVEVAEGDVLLCKINPHLNRVWMVKRRMAQMKLLASSEWIVIRSNEIMPEYLVLVMQSPYFRELMMSNVSGVGGSLMRAQPTFVKQYMLPIPPIGEQKRIIEKVVQFNLYIDTIASTLL